MRKFLIVLFMISSLSAFSENQKTLSKWKFHSGDPGGAAAALFYDDSSWEEVRVPHDWAIGKPFDMRIDMTISEEGEGKTSVMRTGRTGALPAFGVGYYRTEIDSDPSIRGKRIRIEFDGVMSLAKVWLNGEYVGEHPYGYTSFAFDVTDKWNFDGKNLLAVRVENKENSSRWYTGAGIYRHVRLVVSDPVSVGYQGVFVTTPQVTPKMGIAHVSTLVENHSGKTQKVRLESVVFDSGKHRIGSRASQKSIAGGAVTFEHDIRIMNPQLWSIEIPQLYTLVSNVYVDGQLRDRHETVFGIRTLRFDKDKGFFLNGKHMKIKGVCMHHDLGPLGAAVNRRATERQLEMMKEMGCNAIRTAHNPPSPELLDLCDRMGFVVMEEAFDEWRIGKRPNGYHLYFSEWAERDIESMVRRDRNHPSVIMWSMGNEVRDQGSKDGAATVKMLVDCCHKEDPTRPTTAAFNNHNGAIKMGLADQIDVVGFNYKFWDYANKHKEYPDFILFGSETASTVSSRGEYKFSVKESGNPYYEDCHVSSYDFEHPSWGSTPETEFMQQDSLDFLLGEFAWTGFDYLGEPTPYENGTPARSSYFGIVDLAGLKKDRFYLYQSHWSDTPVLHLLPHWNWEGHEGKNIPVFCYTNYPKAELFVNGKSFGVKEKMHTGSKYERYRLMWNEVPYQKGEIKVVAYNSNGGKADSTTIRTAGGSYRIRALVDRREIAADGNDFAFVTVEITDQDGNLCPRADNLLFFDVKGAARLKALCNGDPTDQTAFSSSYMRAFNGKLVAVIEASEEAGDAELKIYGGNLLPATVKIKVIQNK